MLPRGVVPCVEATYLEATTWRGRPRKSLESLRLVITLGAALPPGVLEKVLVACQYLGAYAKIWRGGAHMAAHSLKDVSHVLFEIVSVEKSASSEGRRPSDAADDGEGGGVEGGASSSAAAEGAGSASAPVPAAAAAALASLDEGGGAPADAEGGGAAAGGANGTKAAIREFELRIEACGAKGATLGIWASLVHIRTLAQEVINELAGLSKRASTAVHCPHCLAARRPSPSVYALKAVLAGPVECSQSGGEVKLHTANLG